MNQTIKRKLSFWSNSLKSLVSLLGGVLLCAQVQAAQVTVNVSADNSQPLANMVVYLTPVAGIQDLPINLEQVIVGQQDKKFSPYVTVLQKGQQITFENADDITHHIYSVSGQNSFDFKIQAGQSLQSSPMESAEEVAMGCNIHDWMSGYVLVVDTPYFSTTDKNGQAVVNISKAGQYVLSVWHPQLDEPNNVMEQRIVIEFDKEQSLAWEIQLKSTLLAIPSQENEDDFDFLEEY